MEFTLGKMVIVMKGNGSNALNMDRELTFFVMEMFIQGSTWKVNLKVRANILGGMDKYMLENSRMVSSTEKENGEVVKDPK